MTTGSTTEILKGKVALITGAGSQRGMGRVMAFALLQAGARVALMDANAEALQQTANQLRETAGDDAVLPVVGDVTDWADAQRVVAETVGSLGGLHVLINNAGSNPRYAGLDADARPEFWELPPEIWKRVIDVNVSGPFMMARAAAAHLVAQRWGRIVGVTTSLDTMLRGIPYGPSKAGHEALIAAMSLELEGTGVTVNALLPGGATNTDFVTDVPGRDPSTLIQPDVMGPPAVWLASDASAKVNGMRIIASRWDEALSGDQNLERAGAPAAWPQLGRQGQYP